MANETTKAEARRRREGMYAKYLVGNGIDIGCGDDPILPDCRRWDLEDGDAQVLDGVPAESFDWVYSSNCLEHMRNPEQALVCWWRVLRPGGYLVFTVPDEDLYEMGIFPSAFNTDHKFTYTISKTSSWSPTTKNICDFFRLLTGHKVVSVRTIDSGYEYGGDERVYRDQTQEGAEAQIEVVVQKEPRQPELVTAMKTVIQCPKCKRSELKLRGITREDRLDTVCGHCGQVAEMGIRNLLEPNA